MSYTGFAREIENRKMSVGRYRNSYVKSDLRHAAHSMLMRNVLRQNWNGRREEVIRRYMYYARKCCVVCTRCIRLYMNNK